MLPLVNTEPQSYHYYLVFLCHPVVLSKCPQVIHRHEDNREVLNAKQPSNERYDTCLTESNGLPRTFGI